MHGDWAELNDPKDISQFVLGTKAETLSRLQNMIKRSIILDQFTFTVSDWKRKSNDLLTQISNRFKNNKVIIRSSALSEDTFNTANAGAYESVLNVKPSDCKELKKSINLVISSYLDKNDLNQILIQPMISELQGSGVIFTRTLENGSPYYVINYDDCSNSTESITSGNSNNFKTFKIRRTTEIPSDIPAPIKKLIDAVSEIEELFAHDKLDIEFAITKGNKVNILQVRPIAVDHNLNFVSDSEIHSSIEDAKNYFTELQVSPPSILGTSAYFGNMPDWNPAEIIGIRPNRLAADLYNHQIMNSAWAAQRSEYGYRDVRPFGLMKFFCGQPYVDIRASFNSFIPKNIDDSLAKKYVDFHLKYLKEHPEFHDKVEFEVVPTCFTFTFSEWKKRFKNSGNFTTKEINKLEHELKAITRNAIKGAHNAESNIFKLSKEIHL